MEPTSPVLLILVAVFGAALLVVVIRATRWWWRSAASLGMIAAGFLIALIAVNDYYGYYQTWGDIANDFGGGQTPAAVTAEHGHSVQGTGSIRYLTIAGTASGISRGAYVYLPPQYNQPAFAHQRFPVMELFHGSPGEPQDWLVRLRILDAMKRLMARHLIGPAILVIPTVNAGNHYEECLNSPLGADETYLTTDLRQVIEHRFRAARDPQEWATGGFSSGGYCAANLALRNPDMFGAAFAMDGYFDPADGPAAAALNHSPTAMAENNPLLLAAHTTWGHSVPAFWLSSGTEGGDLKQSRAMVRALRGVERVPFIVEHGGRHNYYAWAAALPSALSWTWQQISTPDLRHQFPMAGSPERLQITPGGQPSTTPGPDVVGKRSQIVARPKGTP